MKIGNELQLVWVIVALLFAVMSFVLLAVIPYAWAVVDGGCGPIARVLWQFNYQSGSLWAYSGWMFMVVSVLSLIRVASIKK